MEALPKEILQDVILLCDIESVFSLSVVCSIFHSLVDSVADRIAEREHLPSANTLCDVVYTSSLSFRHRCLYSVKRSDDRGLQRLMNDTRFKFSNYIDNALLRAVFQARDENSVLMILPLLNACEIGQCLGKAVKYSMDNLIDHLLQQLEELDENLDGDLDHAIQIASQLGRQDLLEKLKQHFTSYDSEFDLLVVSGDILAGRDFDPQDLLSQGVEYAARVGKVDLLLQEHREDYADVIVCGAIKGGYYEIARKYLDDVEDWDHIVNVAARYARIEFIVEIMGGIEDQIITSACQCDRDDILREIESINVLDCIDVAAEHGSKKCLRYLLTIDDSTEVKLKIATGFIISGEARELRKVLKPLEPRDIQHVLDLAQNVNSFVSPDMIEIVKEYL